MGEVSFLPINKKNKRGGFWGLGGFLDLAYSSSSHGLSGEKILSKAPIIMQNESIPSNRILNSGVIIINSGSNGKVNMIGSKVLAETQNADPNEIIECARTFDSACGLSKM